MKNKNCHFSSYEPREGFELQLRNLYEVCAGSLSGSRYWFIYL